MAPRKRKPEHAWMEPYPGLSLRHDGVFELIHPLTKAKVGLKTTDRVAAVRAWQRFMPAWMAEKEEAKADRLMSKLNNMEEIDQLGMDVTLADYAKTYRLDHLPHAKAKNRNGEPLADRTKQDYGNYIRREIECSTLLQFPLADKYADVKIRRFLKRWESHNRTYNYMRSILSIVYDHAHRAGTVRHNPIGDVISAERTERLVYLDDVAYSAITTCMMLHVYFGKENDGEWRARICDLALFSGCRPADVAKIEDSWFDEKGILKYRAGKNAKLIELEDVTGALAETVLWLRKFKRDQGKISKYLCIYPHYMGKRMFKQERASALNISRMWSVNVVAAGYKLGDFIYRDIRKKSLADDSGQNKGGHSAAMQKYYEKVLERPHKVKNNLINPRSSKRSDTV